MKLERIKQKIKRIFPLVQRKYKVKSIGIFGSFAKGRQKKKSDIDVLVEFTEPIGFFNFIELEDFLSKELRIKVDLVMKDVLKPRIKDIILKEALYV